MFSRAVRHDALTHNPVTETRLPRDRRRPVTANSMDALRELRADVAEWSEKRSDRAVVLDMLDLFVATGMRPGELLAVQYQDIDLQDGTLAVTGTVKRDSVHGLHRQEYTKTVSGMRVLHLPSWAVSILRMRKMACSSALVFPNADGNLMEPNNFRRRWRAARGTRWADVELRAFRRSVATLIEREYGAVVASQQLGHSNVEVTRRHYIQRATDTPDSSPALELFRNKRSGVATPKEC